MGDIFSGHNETVVDGQTSFEVSIPNGAKSFELVCKITNWQYNKYQSGTIDMFFEHGPDDSYESNSSVFFPILENTDGVTFIMFEIPKAMYSVTVYLRGTFTAYLELYPQSTKVETASTTNTGIVRPVANGGLKVIEKDNTETNEKAGDLSINCGDGILITEDGKLSTTSDLSGSNWQSLYRFKNGFIVNGKLKEDGTVDASTGYFFERQENGSLLYKNANRVITIASYDTSMPTYTTSTPTEEEESGTNAV